MPADNARCLLIGNNIANNAIIKTRGTRWLLLLLFVIGYIVTCSLFDLFALEYLSLTILSFLACWLLLSCLNPPSTNKLPIWTLLMIFVLYYIQFYWIALYPDTIIKNEFWFQPLHWLAYSKDVLLKAYATVTYAFVTFCLTALFLVENSKIPQKTKPFERNFNYNSTASTLSLFVPILMVTTFYFMYITGISRMASESVYLPFRLAGWIHYARLTLIPGLLLLLIWCSDRAGLRRHFKIGMTLLILHGISDILLRASRGAVLGLFILLAVLFITTGRINKHRIQLFISIILFTSMLFPVISSYRSIRAGDSQISISQSIQEALESSSYESSDSDEKMAGGISSMLFRGGMTSIIPVVGTGIEPLGTKAFKTSVTRFFTVDILGYSPDHIHGSAPSLIGWFYIVGGNLFVITGIFFFTLLSGIYWRTLAKSNLHCLPVAHALFLYALFNVSIEGTLEGLSLRVLVLTGTIAACEWLLRLSGTRNANYLLQAKPFHQIKIHPDSIKTGPHKLETEESSEVNDKGETNIE